MNTWFSKDPEPSDKKYKNLEVFRIFFIALILISLIFTNLVVFIPLKFFESKFNLDRRSYLIVNFVSRLALRFLKIDYNIYGEPMKENGCIVSNHVSWLDIFSLSAVLNIVFVSKSDVSQWFGIGFLAKIVGVLFINRDKTQIIANNQSLEDRLFLGERLLFFPEGTSSDGLQVLPFKSTLFQALIEADKKLLNLYVQGVTIRYSAPEGEDKRFYGWWGDISFKDHLFRILSNKKGGKIDLFFHSPRKVSEFMGRKDMSRSLEQEIASILA